MLTDGWDQRFIFQFCERKASIIRFDFAGRKTNERRRKQKSRGQTWSDTHNNIELPVSSATRSPTIGNHVHMYVAGQSGERKSQSHHLKGIS